MRLHFGLRLQPELRPWRASVPHVRGGHWGEERRRGGCGRRAGRAPGPHVARPRSWGWGRCASVTRLLLQNLASRAGEGVGGNYPTANGCGYLVKVRGRSRSRSPLPHPRQPHSSYHQDHGGTWKGRPESCPLKPDSSPLRLMVKYIWEAQGPRSLLHVPVGSGDVARTAEARSLVVLCLQSPTASS